LVAILKANFEKHGRGAEKIEHGDFVIQDSVTQRDIDLTGDWELCFSPGLRVDMSMIVRGPVQIQQYGNCPRCFTPCPGFELEWIIALEEKDIDW